jgi:hypothetical protein
MRICLPFFKQRAIYTSATEQVRFRLEPRLVALSRSSVRLVTIARANLALAYAHAGQPAEACRLSWETLHGMEHVDSLSARSELRRTVRVLDQWHGRSDVQDLTHRLGSRAPIA